MVIQMVSGTDLTASGVPWNEYGDYLNAYQAAGGTFVDTSANQAIAAQVLPAFQPTADVPGGVISMSGSTGSGLLTDSAVSTAATAVLTAAQATSVNNASSIDVSGVSLSSITALISAYLKKDWVAVGTALIGIATAIGIGGDVIAVAAALAAAGFISYEIYKAITSHVGKTGKAKHRARRYSIGPNPRLGTLIKVAKRADKITARFSQRMRHAGIVKIQGRHSYRPYGRMRRERA